MSALVRQFPSASPDITHITPEPFEPKPLIADILRTRFCIPDSIFLVEAVDVAHTSMSEKWRAIRLLLGDGEFCIQALLSAEMHRLVDRGEILFGSYVKLQQFRVEWREIASSESISSRENGAASETTEKAKQMVYLIVDSLVVVGWNNALTDVPVNDISETILDPVGPGSKIVKPDKATQPEPGDHKEPVIIDDKVASDDKITHKREEVVMEVVNSEPYTAPSTGYLPLSINDQLQPVKLTTLRSIPNLPRKQNYSVNVLCVVSSLSEVGPARIAPYTQRRARLADPSTDKHVQLTVFLDPQSFNPQVGSVVLLLGVKNHRFDGGSLNKYDTDRPKSGQNWWFNSPTQFTWCDVDGLHRWWENRPQV
ncbi:hypothetical protein GGS21DRAFT_306911 [Xylaria nigripes]|nr:hypothetical protein GGS21DRAFT_306911 [Xylaria nigripes]